MAALVYRLQRHPTVDGFTVGDICHLSPSGELGPRLWYTGEDPIREQPGVPVAQWKVSEDTAIPSGRYAILITPSARFKRRLPVLVNVPGFAGIRIHVGNTSEDTHGCILPGLRADGKAVWQSQIAFDRWYAEIETALLGGEPVWIDIRNPG